MAATPLRILPSPAALGDHVAGHVLTRIEEARVAGRRFVLGSPTGRTPGPVYTAMARLLEGSRADLAHVVLLMMDEYLVPDAGGFTYAPSSEPWSCHHYAHAEIAARLNAVLPAGRGLREESIWFPDPRDPAAYDARIADAGGIDLFMLASGASDGHVAFNPPGSERESRTRIIPLSEETRRDNLLTFPTFGALHRVPHHGVSVGVATICEAREALMLAWGAGKQRTVSRMRAATGYEPDWPATLIHECERAEIIVDAEAGAG